MQVPMASSNNSVSENKKIKNGQTSKTASKTKKNIDKQKKEENKKKKNKKLKLSNGNSREQRQGGEKEAKRQRQKHVEEEVEDAEGGGEAKTHVFPMNRIRTMLKGEDPNLRVSQEALLAINKAAEKFLESFTREAYACSVQDRKKSLSYKHLSHVVSKQRKYDFLFDFVPEKVKAEDALRERNSRGNR